MPVLYLPLAAFTDADGQDNTLIEATFTSDWIAFLGRIAIKI